jgi:hypothetical protein
VEINSGNSFASDTIVSMPNLNDLGIAASGMEQNPGLEAVLRSDEYNIRITGRIDDIIDGISNPDSVFRPVYLSDTLPEVAVRVRGSGQLQQSDLQEGRLHRVTCGPNGTLRLDGLLIENVAIITACDVNLGNQTRVISSVIASTSTDADAIVGGQENVLGFPDECEEGGESQIVTLGSISFPADVQIFGSQLLAAGDIDFAARGYGVYGTSMVAGGRIDGTSNATMALCNNAVNANFEVDYFKLVQ